MNTCPTLISYWKNSFHLLEACNLLCWHKIMVSSQSLVVQIPFSFTIRDNSTGLTSTILKGKVYVYDSCFNGIPISSSMQVQLSLVYKSILQPVVGPGKKTLAIEYPGVCKQIGRKDCGVFAFAFAFHAGM